MKEIQKVIDIDHKSGKVSVITDEGKNEIIETKRVHQRERKILSKKARQAINILKPIALELLIDRGIASPEDDDYFSGLGYHDHGRRDVDDYRERYRLACVDLTHEGVGANKVARYILNENPNVIASLTLGSRDPKDVDKAVGDFADKIVRYYPRNFPKNAVGPRK